MSEAKAQPEDAAALLFEARQAWRKLQGAEATIARLRKYTRMHPGMASDYERALRVASDSRSTINRILRGTEP